MHGFKHHLVPVTPPCVGGISPASLQLPKGQSCLLSGSWVSCKGRRVPSTGRADASGLGGSRAAGVGELQ